MRVAVALSVHNAHILIMHILGNHKKYLVVRRLF